MQPLQDFRFDKSEYERPTQKWVCGKTAEGKACRIGPDTKGRCRATYECNPLSQGERWRCTRPKNAGGKCVEGPLPAGTCSKPITKCQPVLSIRQKRGATAILVSAFTLGLILLFLGGPKLRDLKNSIISPGDLSNPHGAIQNCTSCHIAALEASEDSLRLAWAASSGLGETALCLSCHQNSNTDALQAHGLGSAKLAFITERMLKAGAPPSTPLSLTLASFGPAIPQNDNHEIPCSACHQEHRGRGFKITDMNNKTCQACHVTQFTSFANGHPEFSNFPLQDGMGYGFDHGVHEKEHFPKEEIEFTCYNCHYPDVARRNFLVKGFEETCTSCHNHVEQISRDGVAFFGLPGVDYETLLEYDISIGQWPVDAGIDLDTDLSPFMKLLLSKNSEVADDLQMLSDAEISLYDLVDAEEEEIAAAGRVVWALKELYYDLIRNGREGLVAQLTKILGSDLSVRELTALIDQRSVEDSLPQQPELFAALKAAQEEWLPDLMKEIPRYRSKRAVAFNEHEDYEELEENAWGGWSLEFDSFSVRYQASGHADDFLRRWLEVSSRFYFENETAQGIFDLLNATDAPGQCMKCHSSAANKDLVHQVNWAKKQTLETTHKLTQFIHAPHLVKDCRNCHTYGSQNGFEPISRNTCAECHTQGKATENCLNCHNYHVRQFTLVQSH